MDTIYLSIAGFKIRIKFHATESPYRKETLKKAIKTHFKGFIIKPPKQINYQIDFVEQNLFKIFRKLDKNQHFLNFFEYSSNTLITYYHLSISQFEFILRTVILNLLSQNNGFIIHASAIRKNGKAYIFTGPSGSGKSTVIKLLRNEYQALADDSVIIRLIENKYYLYQVPITEKEWWVEKGFSKYLIEGIYFLQKANIFRMDKIENKDIIVNKVLDQFWVRDKKSTKKQMAYVLKFLSLFHNFYTLSFRKEKIGLTKALSNKENQKY